MQAGLKTKATFPKAVHSSSMTKMNIAVGILFLLASTGPALSARERCGNRICAENAVCTHQFEEVCQCLPGYTGEGRYICVPRDSECACFVYGDPLVLTFDSTMLQLHLDSWHTLAQVEEEGKWLFTASVLGRSFPGKPQFNVLSRMNWTFAVAGLDPIEGTYDTSYITLMKPRVESITESTVISVEDHNVTIEFIPDKWISITSNYADAEIRLRGVVIAVLAKLASNVVRPDSTSLCGTCGQDSMSYIAEHDLGRSLGDLTPTEVEVVRVIRVLYALSRQDEDFVALKSAVDRCTVVPTAVEHCLPLLDPVGAFASCVTGSVLKGNIISCLNLACVSKFEEVCDLLDYLRKECDPSMILDCSHAHP